MESVLEILKYTIPSVVVFLTAWLLMKSYMDKETRHKVKEIEAEHKTKMLELKMERTKQTLPLRLQAYERILMLLERISADNLIMRLRNPNYGTGEMHAILLKTIRDEFDHNLSQQLYISSEAWGFVKNAKEEMIQLINTVGTTMKENENGLDLCRRILEESAKLQRYPTLVASEMIKKEVKKIF